MTHKPRTRALVLVLVVVAAFGAGVRIGRESGMHPPVYTADGYVGADVASFQVGDDSFGFRSSVSWTDTAGSFHDSGWPECLPRLRAAGGVRFAGATIWAGDVGVSQVTWVDCQSH